MQESGERKVQGRATWAADSTAGPPAAWAGRSPGSRAGARGTPVPAQPPTSSGPCRSLEEASVSPSERQVLEGRRDRGQRAARRRRPSPPRRPPRGPFPSAGPRASSPGRIPRTWYSASSSLDRRLPEPPIAHSSANSSRDAGNFLTSALGPRHLPVPAATAPEGGPRPGPGPASSLQRPEVPRGVQTPGPRSGRSLASWGRGQGRGQATGPASGADGAGHAARVRACVRAGCACAEDAASSLRCGCRSCGSVARSVLFACRERRRRPRVRSGEGQQGSLGSRGPGNSLSGHWPPLPLCLRTALAPDVTPRPPPRVLQPPRRLCRHPRTPTAGRPMAVSAGSNETSYLLPPNREDWEEQGIPDFVYGQKELTREGIQWPRTPPRPPDTLPLSRFDSALLSAWRQRMELGLFRYCLGELRTQTLPGPMGFVAQLNVERGVQRRRPQNIRSVRQAFDPEEFNFNKIRPGEVLFRLRREPDPRGFSRKRISS
ncbi:hypothetical protein QTO34_012741 [Cnephaeus nilssonii]|uniref:GDPGP1-like N-terminal domain-containing protein n=1 Tax=Cnephaeus nilssonii TaxID=3371016 RepID=A0AA40HB73_CNENI|nr:hypothetical protein QTO34_012741 [Eptesicus nilssonii]